MAGTMWLDPRWPDPRFLIPKPIVATIEAIERGRGHLRQETNPFRRLELEQLLIQASRGDFKAVNKLWALGPPPARDEIYKQHREREDARAAWLEDRKRRTKKTTPSRLRLWGPEKKSSVAVGIIVLFISLSTWEDAKTT